MGWVDSSRQLSTDFLWCVQAHKRNKTWLRSTNVQPLQPYIFHISGNLFSFDHLLSYGEKQIFLFDKAAASKSYVKQAPICQSQTFVALQGLWLRHNTKSSLGRQVVSKRNKDLQRRNYQHSAMKNKEKPSKQSLACSIFNSFTARHKGVCQTTEETSGGWQRNGKKREDRGEEHREFSIHKGVRYTCSHAPITYCISQKCL